MGYLKKQVLISIISQKTIATLILLCSIVFCLISGVLMMPAYSQEAQDHAYPPPNPPKIGFSLPQLDQQAQIPLSMKPIASGSITKPLTAVIRTAMNSR